MYNFQSNQKKKEHDKEPLRTGKLSGAHETRMNLHLLIEREEKFFLDQSPSTPVGLWWPWKRFLVVCFITTVLPIIEQAECANGNRRRTTSFFPAGPLLFRCAGQSFSFWLQLSGQSTSSSETVGCEITEQNKTQNGQFSLISKQSFN